MNDQIKALEDALRDVLNGENWRAGKKFDPNSGNFDLSVQRAALAASQPAPDCHQPDLVTADSSQPAQPVAVTWPARCDGVEQDAFEAWAKDNHYDMELHPLHWLFLNARTSAARDGWAAGLAHAVDRMRAALDVHPLTVQDAARVPEIAALIDAVNGLMEVFPDPCRYDHHGKCQEHFIEDDCSVAKTIAALRAIAEGQ